MALSPYDSKITSIEFSQEIFWLKPGLYIRRKDRKHGLEDMFFKLSSYGLVSI